jgi:4-carboxymuconolactone decarboxylase
MIEYLDVIYGLDPDWCELFLQYVRAGLYSREIVPQSTREVCACAVLAALDKQAQLKQHLVSGLAAGATKEQLLEAVLQSVTYGGFPAVMSSIRTYVEVFPEMVKHDRPAIPASQGEPPTGPRFPLAVETATSLWGEEHMEAMFGRYDRWDADYSMLCQTWVHGGLYARTVVSPELRELIAIACLTARNAIPQLETHLVVGFRIGIPRVEMQEIILQMMISSLIVDDREEVQNGPDRSARLPPRQHLRPGAGRRLPGRARPAMPRLHPPTAGLALRRRLPGHAHRPHSQAPRLPTALG